MNSEEDRELESWLDAKPNRKQWKRLELALELAGGFQFLPVYATNPDVDRRVGALLQRWGDGHSVKVLGFPLDSPPGEATAEASLLRVLEAEEAPRIFWFPLGPSLQRGRRSDEESSRVHSLFRALNQKRDQISRRARSPVLIGMHADDWREFRLQARDFWSIRQGTWRFVDVQRPMLDAASRQTDNLKRARRAADLALSKPPTDLLAPPRPRPIPSAPHPGDALEGRSRESTLLQGTLMAGRGPAVVRGPLGSGKTSLALSAASQVSPKFKDGVLFLYDGRTYAKDPTEWVARRIIEHFAPSAGLPSEKAQLLARARDLLNRRNVLLIIDELVSGEVLVALNMKPGRSQLLATAEDGRALVDVRAMDWPKALELQLPGRDELASGSQALAPIRLPERSTWATLSIARQTTPQRLAKWARRPVDEDSPPISGTPRSLVFSVLEDLNVAQRDVLSACVTLKRPAPVDLIARLGALSADTVRGTIESITQLVEPRGAGFLLVPGLREDCVAWLRQFAGPDPERQTASTLLASPELAAAYPEEAAAQAANILALDLAGEHWMDPAVMEVAARVLLHAALDSIPEGTQRWGQVLERVGQDFGRLGLETIGGILATPGVKLPPLRAVARRTQATDEDLGKLLSDTVLDGGIDVVGARRLLRLERAEEADDPLETASAAMALARWRSERGDVAGAHSVLNRSSLRQRSEPVTKAGLASVRSEVFAAGGDLNGALKAQLQAVNWATEFGHRGLEGSTQIGAAVLHLALGNAAGAAKLARLAVAAYEAASEPLHHAFALSVLGKSLSREGRFEDARIQIERARVAYDRLGNREGLRDAEQSLGELALRAGDLSSAADHFRRARTLATQVQDLAGEGDAISQLALVLEGLGRAGEAAGLADEWVKIARGLGGGDQEHSALILRSRLRADLGQLPEALADAVAASRGALRTGADGLLAAATLAESDIHATNADWQASVEAARRALTLAATSSAVDTRQIGSALTLLVPAHRALGNSELAQALDHYGRIGGQPQSDVVRAEIGTAITEFKSWRDAVLKEEDAVSLGVTNDRT